MVNLLGQRLNNQTRGTWNIRQMLFVESGGVGREQSFPNPLLFSVLQQLDKFKAVSENANENILSSLPRRF